MGDFNDPATGLMTAITPCLFTTRSDMTDIVMPGENELNRFSHISSVQAKMLVGIFRANDDYGVKEVWQTLGIMNIRAGYNHGERYAAFVHL